MRRRATGVRSVITRRRCTVRIQPLRSMQIWAPPTSLAKTTKLPAEYYEEALKLDPEVFEHHSTFGTLMQERTVEERAMFHLYLAKTYAKSGANERALIYLRKALEEGVKDRNKIPDMPEFTLSRRLRTSNSYWPKIPSRYRGKAATRS